MLRERPENFTLKRDHILAKGLVFAGLGGGRGSVRYRDSSPYCNNGTLTDMTPDDWVWVPELGRWALDFDGSNDYVSIAPVFPSLPHDISFALTGWVSPLSTGSSRTLYGEGPSASFIRHQCSVNWDRALLYDNYPTSGGSVVSDGLISISTWTHIGICRAVGGSISFYISGLLDSVKTGDTYNRSDVTLAWIGSRWGGDQFYKGRISDLLIHNRILSPSEIQQLADPSNVMLSGLVLPPKRKYYGIFPTIYSQRFFSLKTSLGNFALKG